MTSTAPLPAGPAPAGDGRSYADRPGAAEQRRQQQSRPAALAAGFGQQLVNVTQQ